MQLSYRLKRVCGSVYTNGNIVFTPDGNSIISSVGNRVTVFDLIHHTTTTFPFENKKSIESIAISHNGLFLLTIDVDGHALLINFPRMLILTRIHFKRKVCSVKFSPNDQYFAITYHHGCQIWRTPGTTREFSPLILSRTIGNLHDETTCLDWSSDSKSIILGSKDLHAQVYMNVSSKYMSSTTLSGHREAVVGCCFGADPHQAYTISKNGGIFSWTYEFDPNARPIATAVPQVVEEPGDETSDDDDQSEISEPLFKKARSSLQNQHRNKTAGKAGQWKLVERKFLWEEHAEVSSVAYNRATSLLVIGYEHGTFGLYDLSSDCANLHRLSISTSMINMANINTTGEWLVLGSSSLGQLCVWEWKSETFILKQQGHTRNLNVVDYSKDGLYIASGGDDGKMKLWNTSSGFCFITFSDHLAPITGVKFIGQGASKAVLSSSLDGTIRAYDMLRYHNFKTYTSPTLVQFTSLAVDSSGEMVCAGSLDPFNIYLWSIQTAQLLNVFAGHEGPIACLEISAIGSVLASGSWDGTLKLWNIYENSNIETMEHGCDVLAIAYRPDGKEIATCTTNGNITFWDVESGEQRGLIEGRLDIAGGRLSTDAMTSKNSARSKYFTTITYSSDGCFVLAAGRSKFACIYAVESKILVKKFQLSYNRSLEGILDELRSDRLVDGIALDNLPSVDAEHSHRKKTADDGSRNTRPELLTSCIRFSPTGREWAAATTQGLQIFGLDHQMMFLPTDLDVTITPQAIDEAIYRKEYGFALNMALQLNEKTTLRKAFACVPMDSVNLVVKSINALAMPALLKLLAEEIVSG
jgi:periodic tryptophan protein 2